MKVRNSRLFKKRHGSIPIKVIASCATAAGLILKFASADANLPDLVSLKQVQVPEPVNLKEFVKDKKAAIVLGKALFWDMQLGSSGIQSCASCHFQAGADNRVKNTVSPGLNAGDNTFQIPGPNGMIASGLFPLTKFEFPDRPGFEKDQKNFFVHSFNDVISSQGVRHFQFKDIIPGKSYEKASVVSDPIFGVLGKNTRRVEPRNTPTVINAIFNFSSFWDGRARNIFNGVNPFGELDEEAVVFENDSNGLHPTQVRIPDASLASQAVGPPGSDFEMSSIGRTFPKIGKKMLKLKPLARQKVSSTDSVLGPYSDGHGLSISYASLIAKAFQDKWWKDRDHVITFDVIDEYLHKPDKGDPRTYYFNHGVPSISQRATAQHRSGSDESSESDLSTSEYTQMEANFSLFFGLAVQLYEATLVSDNAKFDLVAEGKAKFTPDEQRGMEIFFNQGRCNNCHRSPEFMNHSVRNVRQGEVPQAPGFLADNIIEFMNIANRQNIIYDNGFYNIAVRPAGSNIPGAPGFVARNEDIARGNNAPMINPLTKEPYPLSIVRLAELKAKNLLPPGVAQFVPSLPPGVSPDNDVAVDGSQKAPTLRNVELTGPYFHNGDAATLKQVVEFYTRGGNFPVTNEFNLDPDIEPIPFLAGHPERQDQLVAFLKTLTDERVRQEQAPFDHPQLFVPNGSPGNAMNLLCTDSADPNFHKSFCDDFIEIPAVGALGRPDKNLPPLGTFLDLEETDSLRLQ